MYQIHPTNTNTEATITTLLPPAPVGSGPTRHGRKLSHVQFGKRSHSGLDDYAFSVLTMPFDDKFKVPSLSSRLTSPITSEIQIEEDISKEDNHSLSPQHQSYTKRYLRWLFTTTNLGPFTKGSHWPLFTYLMVAFTIITFSGELLLGKQSSGEFFELEPFNYMLGPSMEIMIQAGARFPPCMRHVESMSSSQRYICLHTLQQSSSLTPSALISSNRTVSPPPTQHQSFVLLDPLIDLNNPQLLNSTCTLANICGMTAFHQDKVPDQTFRLLTPLFVHTGIVHLCLNLMVLLILGTRVERTINSLRFSILFICSGVFGHALGANIAPATTPFLGFSSSLFGLLGYLFVDLAINWRRLDQSFKYLLKLVVTTGGTFMLGLLPGVDTFSHLGGLLGGALLGFFLIPVKWWPYSDMTITKVILVHCLRILSVTIYIVSFALLVHFFSIVKLGEVCTYCK